MWVQNYDPFGSWPLSTLAAALPVVILLGLLASGKANAWQSALAGLTTAALAAVFIFGMPIRLAALSAAYGMVFAAFRIVWLIIAAVFLYDIAVETGEFEVMKRSIAQLSADRRIQAILVAFGFGAFIEGAAGFGAPVAISAAFLVGLGFRPTRAAVLCLIANTAPVAWGAIGTPIQTLATITGLNVHALSAEAGKILPPLSLIIPIWLVKTMTTWRKTLEIWPALLTIGGAFAVTQWFWSSRGFELVDIVSSVSSLVAGMILLRFWRPKNVWRFEHDDDSTADGSVEPIDGRLTGGRVARAWLPFGLLTLTVLIWGVPEIKRAMGKATDWKPKLAGLHLRIAKGEAVTGHSEPTEKDRETAVLDIVPATSTGTAVFLAAIVGGLILGASPKSLAIMFGRTLVRLAPACAAIFAMLALGFLTKFAGMDAVLGLALTRTGRGFYPIFGTMLGWLGVALTGSDTSSNVLFGNLQVITAKKLRLDPILMAAANTTGGVMGKMIDAQSIVVAAAATGETGKEGTILRAVFFHSVVLALLVGLIVWLRAFAIPA